MAARGRGWRIRGHPLHAMMAAVPVASWLAVGVWDALAFLAPHPRWSELAFYTLALGLVAAVPTLATGLAELAAVEPGHPAERIAWSHMIVMLLASSLMLASLLLRGGAPAPPPTWPAWTSSALGIALVAVGGWLGGDLVFRHGVGVDLEAKE